MNRLSVIQKIINAINAEYYLEIGVASGEILINVDAKYKFGVDPEFKIPNLKVNGKQSFSDNKNNLINLYEIESDLFFNNFVFNDLKKGIDVAFVDGLHTYTQSLKDIKNCLKYLNTNGFIIVHDCNPLNFSMGYPVKESIDEVINLGNSGDLAGWNGLWNGDVWKAIAHLRTEYDDLEIFTLDLDWGLGIITKGKGQKLTGVSIEDIEKADYYFLEKNREHLLNLKHPKYLDDYLKTKI